MLQNTRSNRVPEASAAPSSGPRRRRRVNPTLLAGCGSCLDRRQGETLSRRLHVFIDGRNLRFIRAPLFIMSASDQKDLRRLQLGGVGLKVGLTGWVPWTLGGDWGKEEEEGSASTVVVLTPVGICGSFCTRWQNHSLVFQLQYIWFWVMLPAAFICSADCPTVRILPFIVERLWNQSDQAPPPPGNRPGYFRRCPALRLV